jgi:hypothetical protein
MKEGRADEAASGIERIQCHKIFEGTTISVFKGVCVCFCLCRIQELGLRVAVRDFEREVWQRSLDNSRGA